MARASLELTLRLSDFMFPVVGFSRTPARNDPTDNGVREFLDQRSLTRSYLLPGDDRQGMLLIDASGRSWEIVSVEVLGVAGGWFERLWRFLLRDREYQLRYGLEERGPLSFDQVKSHWHTARKANPRVRMMGPTHRQIDGAAKLEDLIGPLVDPPKWSDRLLGIGRCGRLEFMLLGLTLPLAVLSGLSQILNTLLMGFLLVPAIALCGVTATRRLHDIGLSGFRVWLVAVGGAGSVAFVAGRLAWAHHPAMARNCLWFWIAAMAVSLLYLACWPGTKSANEYGYLPGTSRQKRANTVGIWASAGRAS